MSRYEIGSFIGEGDELLFTAEFHGRCDVRQTWCGGAYQAAHLGNDATMTFSQAQPESDDEIKRYVGMELMDAKAAAEAAGWTNVRLLTDGGPRTLEYRPDRLNLTTDGKLKDGFNASSGTGNVIDSSTG
jgi:hypothetical protein